MPTAGVTQKRGEWLINGAADDVDGGTGALLSTSQHPTTIDTDVFEGYDAALSAALASAGVAGVDRVLAASSAAGASSAAAT